MVLQLEDDSVTVLLYPYVLAYPEEEHNNIQPAVVPTSIPACRGAATLERQGEGLCENEQIKQVTTNTMSSKMIFNFK